MRERPREGSAELIRDRQIRRDVGIEHVAEVAPIPHLLHVLPDFDVGGPEVRVVHLANRFAGRYRHTVVSLDGEMSCAARLEAGVDVELVSLRARKSGGLDPGNLARFRSFLRRSRPDILLTYNWGAIEWALANRWFPVAPHLHFEDGFGPDEVSRQLPRRVLFRRLALGGTRTTLVVPSRTLERLATKIWGFAPERVFRIPNGIDCVRFADEGGTTPRRAAAGLATATVATIGTVGVLRPEKNIARLLRCFAAAAAQTPMRLIVAGAGPEQPALEQLAAALGIADRVDFWGRIDAPEEALGAFDVFALSSDTEQMPYTVIEAMAAGLPVVATAVGDIPDMVAEENRPFLTETWDEEGFARRLVLLADVPALRRQVGAANQARAFREFGLDAMCAAYDALLMRIVSHSV